MVRKQSVRVLSSVAGGPVRDLVATLDGIPGVRAGFVAPLADETWRRLRGSGVAGSAVARVLGALFPLRVLLDHRILRGSDVVVATTNPFWLPTAVALRRRRPALVSLVYDVYPDSLEVRRRLPAPLRRAVAAVVAFGLRRADAVVFLGARARDAIVVRHAITAPTAVLQTGADPADLIDPPTPDGTHRGLPAELAGRVVVSYVGNAGSVHDATTLGAALRAVITDRADVAVVLAVTGDRAEELVGRVRGLSGVHILGPLDDATWRWVVARTDVALVALDRTAGLSSLPSKTYAALAAGSAVLAVAPAASDLADLVGTGGSAVGVRVDPGDVAGATTALRDLVDDPDLRARHGAVALSMAARFTPMALAPGWDAVLAAALDHRVNRVGAHRRGRRANAAS